MAKTWVYGRDPSPTNWHETADILRKMSKKKKQKSELVARIGELERMAKDRGK